MQPDEAIEEILRSVEAPPEIRAAYAERLKQGAPTRDENPTSHFCSYFLPYDIKGKKVFLELHKKSGLWLSPGGHIDKGETPLETAQREMEEELGVKGAIASGTRPLFLTVTHIARDPRGCTAHFDIWYFIPAGEANFNTAKEGEFDEARWATLDEARRMVVEENTLKALDFVEREIFGYNQT